MLGEMFDQFEICYVKEAGVKCNCGLYKVFVAYVGLPNMEIE